MSFKRFDFTKEPRSFKWYLRPIAALLANPAWKKYKPKINYYNGVQNLKAPFLLLCNHNAFLDFKIAYKLLKGANPNFVVAIDGYIKREGLMRNIGCICKRKFTNDLSLIRNLKKSIDMGNVPVLYPEARYSLCGTTAVLPASLGKLIKMLNVPVATLICHGHHVNSPFWNTSHERGIEFVEAEYTLLFTKEEIATLNASQINQKVNKAFIYDDFAWQKQNNIKICDAHRAEGLEKVLYKCPNCKTEFEMSSSGATLTCNACHKSWVMTELGELSAQNGKTEFSHIPNWYEWQREQVKKEVELGTYSTGEMPVIVKSLPNTKRYINLGSGTMVHNMNGFSVKLNNPPEQDETSQINLPATSTYSVHIEYNYLFKFGDCVDLNTINDTWYCYPQNCKFSVTKMALATEELYFFERDKLNKRLNKK